MDDVPRQPAADHDAGVDALRRAAESAIEAGRLDRARPLWTRLCEREPADAGHWLILAAIDEQLGFLPAALGHLGYARQLAPDDVDVWVQLARTHWKMQSIGAALDAQAMALTLEFGDAGVRDTLADWQMRCGHFAEALVHFRYFHRVGGIDGEPRQVLALACAWCAGEEGDFRRWSMHTRADDETLVAAIVDRLVHDHPRPGNPALRNLGWQAPLALAVRDALEDWPRRVRWRDWFERRAHVDDHAAPDAWRAVTRRLADAIARDHGGRELRLLDLGCGTGRLGDALSSAACAGFELTGVDFADGCVTAAARKQRYAQLLVRDLDDGLPEELITAADVIVLGEVLEYLHRPFSLLRDVLAALAAEAVVYLAWRPVEAGVDEVVEGVLDAVARVHQREGRLHLDELGSPRVRVLRISHVGWRSPRPTASGTRDRREFMANALVQAKMAYEQNRYDDSAALASKVLHQYPFAAQAHFFLGVAAQHHRDFDTALHHYRQALVNHQGYPEAWFHVGTVYQQTARSARIAIHAYRRCLSLQAGHAAAMTNLVTLYLARGEIGQALGVIHTWRCRVLASPVQRESLVRMLAAAGDPAAQAVTAFDEDPAIRMAELGMALEAKFLARAADLLAALERDDVLPADDPRRGLFRARLAEKGGALAEAERHCREALRLRPGDSAAWQQRAGLAASRGRLHSAMRLWRQAALRAEGPLDPQADVGTHGAVEVPDPLPWHPNALFFSNYAHWLPDAAIARAHVQWGEALLAGLPHAETAAGEGVQAAKPGRSGGRLRIGYVSGDFRAHSVAMFFYDVLKYRNHRRFEVFCYASHGGADNLTVKLRLFSDHWRDISALDDDAAAAQVRRDGIDILVDLAGHTAYNRLGLFARRPAAVQCTYLGYCNTTGLANIDYRITDAVADPPGPADALHSETLVRLPGGFLGYSRHMPGTPVVVDRASDREQRYTFVCCNNASKINDAVIDAWSRILARLPEARLLIKSHNLDNDDILGHFRRRFAARGIGNGQLHLMNTLDVAEHQDLYNRTDIALDPFPYNGTTTTCDALWMGVPVLTLAGSRHAARVGASILTRVGLTDWIAHDIDDYVERAIHHARDADNLRAVKMTLRRQMRESPLMQPGRVAKELETAYKWMWKRWRHRGTRGSLAQGTASSRTTAHAVVEARQKGGATGSVSGVPMETG